MYTQKTRLRKFLGGLQFFLWQFVMSVLVLARFIGAFILFFINVAGYLLGSPLCIFRSVWASVNNFLCFTYVGTCFVTVLSSYVRVLHFDQNLRTHIFIPILHLDQYSFTFWNFYSVLSLINVAYSLNPGEASFSTLIPDTFSFVLYISVGIPFQSVICALLFLVFLNYNKPNVALCNQRGCPAYFLPFLRTFSWNRFLRYGNRTACSTIGCQRNVFPEFLFSVNFRHCAWRGC